MARQKFIGNKTAIVYEKQAKWNDCGRAGMVVDFYGSLPQLILFENGVPFTYDHEGNYELEFVNSIGSMYFSDFDEALSAAHCWVG